MTLPNALEDLDVGVGRPFTAQHIRVEQSPRRVRAFLGHVAVADSTRVLLLAERGHLPVYDFPSEDVRMDLLEPSDTVTACPYKGEARYWSTRAGGTALEDVAWSDPAPIPECSKIERLVAFSNERVDLYLDGELQPQAVSAAASAGASASVATCAPQDPMVHDPEPEPRYAPPLRA